MHRIASVCNQTDLVCTKKNSIGPYAPHRIGPYASRRFVIRLICFVLAASDPLGRAKKVALSRLGRKWDEKRREGTAITTKAPILIFQSAIIDSNVIFMAFYALKYQNKCLCCYRRPFSTFFIPLSSEARKLCSPNEDFGRQNNSVASKKVALSRLGRKWHEKRR